MFQVFFSDFWFSFRTIAQIRTAFGIKIEEWSLSKHKIYTSPLITLLELLIDGLGRASPIEDPEACIYGYGAVRFLANASVSPSSAVGNRTSAKDSQMAVNKHKTLAQRLARHGAIPLMILHLQMINETVKISTFTQKPPPN